MCGHAPICMIQKHFRLETVLENRFDAPTVEYLGDILYTVFIGAGTLSRHTINPTDDKEVIDAKTLIADYISGTMFLGNGISDFDPQAETQISKLAPVTTAYSSGAAGMAGNAYLRIVADDGSCLISQTTCTSQGYWTGAMDIYSKEGTRLGTLAAPLYAGLPLVDSVSITNLITDAYTEDGKLDPNGTYRYFRVNAIGGPRLNYIITSTNISSLFIEWVNGLPDYTPQPGPAGDDPYSKGGTSGKGGGTGTFSRTGDLIQIPKLPTLSAVDAGFITLFNPSIGELRSLAAYMWSDAFSIETFKKIFADPMDCILGMSIVPVNVPNGSSKEVKVGNIGTGVSMTTAATQYVSVDCGTLNVEEYWGAYLDYDPYTKAEIYLPYIGTHPVAIDDVMGKSVRVVYHIDILSGACIAFIQCGGTVIYSFAGQCASSIPITGNDWTNVINGVLQIAGSIGTMVATGGISSPMSIANIASTAINSAKPQVEKSGSLGGTGGMLGVQTPYLIITWPRQAVPYRQNAFKGYPSNITSTLGVLSGFTVVDSIHLENVPATGEELDEIINLLREGVIL